MSGQTAGVQRHLVGSVQSDEPTAASTDVRMGDGHVEKPVAHLATVAIVGTALFVVLIAALHFLSPEFNPIERPTSEYATGPFGYLMTAAFLALSLSTWALVIGLRLCIRVEPPGSRQRFDAREENILPPLSSDTRS